MKNILVPIEIHSSINSVLATALLLGKRFGAAIEGVSLGAGPARSRRPSTCR